MSNDAEAREASKDHNLSTKVPKVAEELNLNRELSPEEQENMERLNQAIEKMMKE